ncbi:MAG TPA: glycine cleavage system protein GcvH [bacterium]|nr:glycine cleavage system protein GcvH [bacterium]HPQ67380.1 glycine cleavage system protein GcvH [bacterium]
MSRYFTKDHEWARVEDGACVMGITAYAADQLGDITFIELPEVGRTVAAGDLLCEVESVKAASEIFAPLSGTVVETNGVLAETPELLNRSPEEEAWIARLRLDDPAEAETLMDEARYRDYLAGLE